MKNIILSQKQFHLIIESQAEVDRILDKIYNHGMDSLTIDEKNYLDSFSKHEGHADDFVSPTEKMDQDYQKRGHKITSEIPQLDGMEFIYEDSLENEDSRQIAGDLVFDERTFFLMFEVSDTNELLGYSASEDYMGTDDDLIEYILEKFPNMTYEQADGLLSYYIENEIIPSLP